MRGELVKEIGERKSVIELDWSAGELVYKNWVTDVLPSAPNVSFKVLSKRNPSGEIAFVLTAERMDGFKFLLFEGSKASEEELQAFVWGVQSTLLSMFGDKAQFELQDFSDCESVEEYQKKSEQLTANQFTDTEENRKTDVKKREQ